MIRKIHYVWLGSGKMSKNIQHCLDSWKKMMPEWEIIKWSEENFDVHKYPFIQEAIEKKKYAFAADVIRLLVLRDVGGVYMDTDVEVIDNFEPYLNHHFCSSIEILFKNGWKNMENDIDENGYLISNGTKVGGIGLQAGFIYAEPNHPVITGVLKDIYQNGYRHFINLDNSLNEVIVDGMLMNYLHDNYGLKYRDRTQMLDDDVCIYDSGVFSTYRTLTKRSCIIHNYEQSWNDKGVRGYKRIIQAFKRDYPALYRKVVIFKNTLIK